MKNDTKLNGAIRALYKSKAKTSLEAAAKNRLTPLQKERAEIFAKIGKDPQVKKALQRIASLEKQKKVLFDQLRGLGISGLCDGSGFTFSYDSKKGQKYYAENSRHEAINDQIKRESSCQCQVGDSPELLEFAAHLSLCATVGEAEALLAKIV